MIDQAGVHDTFDTLVSRASFPLQCDHGGGERSAAALRTVSPSGLPTFTAPLTWRLDKIMKGMEAPDTVISEHAASNVMQLPAFSECIGPPLLPPSTHKSKQE